MSTVLQKLSPDGLDVTSQVVTALLVAGTIYLIEGSVREAAATGAAFLALQLATDLADAVVGDYAGNALFGVLVLSGAAYFAALGAVWFPAALAAVGGWLLLDGVQHLRYGVTRDDAGVPSNQVGGALTAIPMVLLHRLLEPVLLGRTHTTDAR